MLPYVDLLKKLKWKPLSQVVMERRAILTHAFVNGRKKMPDAAFRLTEARRSARLGHGKELTIPVSGLEAVQSSSLNVMRIQWKALPEKLVKTTDAAGFKREIKNPNVYDELHKKEALRRVEFEID